MDTGVKPFWSGEAGALYLGDCLSILRGLDDQSVSAIITDPPYSSGGLNVARKAKPSDKYQHNSVLKVYPEFFGDNRDQRSFFLWCTLWMSECFRLSRDKGVLFVFSDWRQLPTVTDAVQTAGWIWRAIVPWDKTNSSRPVKGWFRGQVEYIIAATKGPTPGGNVFLDGFLRQAINPNEKKHMTAKPVALLKNLLSVLPETGTVLDPFAGGGSTLIAARDHGYKFIGCEMSQEYCEIIRSQLDQGVMNFEEVDA